MTDYEILLLEVMGWVGVGLITAGLYLSIGLGAALICAGVFLFLYALVNQDEKLDR